MAATSGAERIPGSGNVNTSHIQTMYPPAAPSTCRPKAPSEAQAGSSVGGRLTEVATARLQVWTKRRRCSSCKSTMARTARERYGRLDDIRRGKAILNGSSEEGGGGGPERLS